jgi:hypothetical protein
MPALVVYWSVSFDASAFLWFKTPKHIFSQTVFSEKAVQKRPTLASQPRSACPESHKVDPIDIRRAKL